MSKAKYRTVNINGLKMRVRCRHFLQGLESNIFAIGSDRELHLKDSKSRKIINHVQARGL